MGDAPVGHRAANLPWLCPAGASLVALADEHPDARVLAADPTAVLLLLRYTRPTPPPAEFRLDPVAFVEPALPEAAAHYLASTAAGRLTLSHPATAELILFARSAARVAAELASQTQTASPVAAAAAALLAPLGWLLVASVDPAAVVTCRNAIRDGEDLPAAQYRLWGLTHDGIVRRAACRWRLPTWVAAVVGNPGLPTDVTVRLGTTRGLTEVVRAAVSVCEARILDLGITRASPHPPPSDLTRLAEQSVEVPYHPHSSERRRRTVPITFVVKLLSAAARARRAEAAGRLERVHSQLDRTGERLRAETSRFETRVRDAKLAALAELAAGAGHEINNPLAVISGNAQLLLSRTDDPAARKALDSIMRQSRRLSEIVNDLMQYARPRPPTASVFELASWVNQAVGESRPAAAVKGVELTVSTPPSQVWLHADIGQLGRALAALVRNAVEAAQAGGWVRITARTRPGGVAVVVEDSGLGPSGAVAEHMFDPFFSGRTAGRGRGLGLPTAWRLARENGGDVRYEPSDGGPTRFVLEIPLPAQLAEPVPGRKSA